MGDGAEGLVDAEARIQDRLDEIEQQRMVRRRVATDPERERRVESLRLARTEMQRQSAATEHPVRLEQLRHAIAELDRRLAELTGSSK